MCRINAGAEPVINFLFAAALFFDADDARPPQWIDPATTCKYLSEGGYNPRQLYTVDGHYKLTIHTTSYDIACAYPEPVIMSEDVQRKITKYNWAWHDKCGGYLEDADITGRFTGRFERRSRLDEEGRPTFANYFTILDIESKDIDPSSITCPLGS